MESEEPPTDSDHDGMPDEWEIANSLDPDNAEDGKLITESGYSNLELYLHSLVDMEHEAENPSVELVSPKANSVHKAHKKIQFNVKLEDKKNIEKVEYFKNDEKKSERRQAVPSHSHGRMLLMEHGLFQQGQQIRKEMRRKQPPLPFM